MKLLPTALAALILALPVAACEKGKDAGSVLKSVKPDPFGEKVRAYLLEHPEVIEEAVNKLQEKKQTQAEAAHKADLAMAAAALPKHRAALERDPRDFVANPNGSITVVEFFDYNCGYCKLAAPEIVKLIEENPDVRFVFKEFPIFGEASDTAAKISLTDAGKSRGLELYSTWMAEKPLDEAAIDRRLKAMGLNPTDVRKAAASPEIAKHIADIRDLALALKIQGTPAFIVGDTIIPGADMAALKSAIAAAKSGGAKMAEG